MVFYAKSSSPTEWKLIANTVATLVEEATFEATAEGLGFRAMDPSHIALIDLFLPNSAFEKYDCDGVFKFTVRVDDFSKLLKRAESKDSVEVMSGEDETLLLRFSNSYKREFRIHLIESMGGPTPLPKLSFNTKLLISTSSFQRILSDVSTISDHILIETSKDRLIFSGKSDMGDVSASLDKSSTDLLELQVREESKATYSIEYLLNITKVASSASDTVSLEYSSKMPLKLEFKLGERGGRVNFYLAPRIEER